MINLLMFGILNLTLALASTSDNLNQYREPENQYGDKFPNAAYAMDAFNNSDYISCIKIGQKTVKLEPQNPDPHFVMGRCFERMLQFKESWLEYNTVIKLEPKYQDAHNNRVLLSLKMFNLKRAQKELVEWKKLDQKDKRISEYEGYVSQAIKQTKEGKYTAAFAKSYIKVGYKKALTEKRITTDLQGFEK